MRFVVLFASCIASCGGSPPRESSPGPTPSPPSDATAKAGEACGGVRQIGCAEGLQCHVDDTPLPAPSDAGLPAESGVGGPCGGIAGFHCQAGLVCTMSADQEIAADGMGECGPKATCVTAAP